MDVSAGGVDQLVGTLDDGLGKDGLLLLGNTGAIEMGETSTRPKSRSRDLGVAKRLHHGAASNDVAMLGGGKRVGAATLWPKINRGLCGRVTAANMEFKIVHECFSEGR